LRTAALPGVPGLFLLVNIVAVPFSESGFWPRVLCSGVVMGQTNLIALWTGLMQVNVVMRVSVASFLCALLWTSVILSRYPGVLAPAQVVLGLAMDTAGVVVLLQIPLAVVALVRGWRLTVWTTGSGESGHVASQFRLTHILWAILLLSASLGLVRVWFSQWIAIGFTHRDIGEAVVAQLVPLAIATIMNALLLLPSIRIAFVSARWFVPAVIGILAYFVGLGLLIALVYSCLYERRVMDMWILVRLFTVLPTYCVHVMTTGATVLLTLGVFRALGCRFECGRPKRSPSARTASAEGV
jgi:hypothetical protein